MTRPTAETIEKATDRAHSLIGKAEIDAYRRDGAVCVRGLFSADEVAAGIAGITENMAAPSERAKVASRPEDPGYFIEDFCNWQTNRHYRDLIFNSAAAAFQLAAVVKGWSEDPHAPAWLNQLEDRLTTHGSWNPGVARSRAAP